MNYTLCLQRAYYDYLIDNFQVSIKSVEIYVAFVYLSTVSVIQL
jgi:hypothetical protein